MKSTVTYFLLTTTLVQLFSATRSYSEVHDIPKCEYKFSVDAIRIWGFIDGKLVESRAAVFQEHVFLVNSLLTINGTPSAIGEKNGNGVEMAFRIVKKDGEREGDIEEIFSKSALLDDIVAKLGPPMIANPFGAIYSHWMLAEYGDDLSRQLYIIHAYFDGPKAAQRLKSVFIWKGNEMVESTS